MEQTLEEKLSPDEVEHLSVEDAARRYRPRVIREQA
jgi:hypothetical protein